MVQPPKECDGAAPDAPHGVQADRLRRSYDNLWPWLALAVVLAVAVLQLRHQGRVWWCDCGSLSPWSGNIWSSHNSQHLFDPYSFTHMLHGLILCGLTTLACRKLPPAWRFCLAISLEALWEVFENTEFIIRRYRMVTIALNYEGDSIVNSLGDILSCGFGYAIAQKLGFARSLILFLATEAVLVLWIGDSLLFDLARLIYPG